MSSRKYGFLPMANAIGVQVVESVEGLAHDEGSLGFSQVLALGDEEEKFATFAQPKNKEIKNKQG